jgi:hypothetical protein
MAVEENLNNKYLYNLFILILKFIPSIIVMIHLLSTILSYFSIDLVILSYIGSISLLPLLFMYLASYVFKFCSYHRMFLHYSVIINSLNIYDYYIGIPISNMEIIMVHIIISIIFSFIITYLYLKE